jgi:hypothetical protein
VWALGVSLYVAVEGEPPYAEQANAIAMLNTIASEQPPAPARAGPLAPAMQHMMDLDPETRWTMARSAAALRELAIDEAMPALPVDDPAPPTPVRGDLPPDDRPPDTVPTRAVRPRSAPRRRRALLVIAASVAVALVALGGWWSTRDPGADSSADRPGAGVRRTPTKPASSSAPATPSGGASSSASSASSSSNASNPAPSSSASSSAPAPGGAEADSPADLVADYYGLLPEDTRTAWDLLAPELQDQIGEGTFEGFWATIDDVRVDDTEEVGDGLVEVTLTYVTDGRSEQETRQLAVARVGDGFLISDDMGAV